MSFFRQAKLSDKAGSALKVSHPWIFSRAITECNADEGEPVKVFSHDGVFVGIFSYHPHTDIALRLLMSAEEVVTRGFGDMSMEKFIDNFFTLRFKQSIALRKLILERSTTGYRVVNGEGDLLPGIVLDRYRDVGVLQLGNLFSERYRGNIIDTVRREIQFSHLWERSQGSGRKREKLQPSQGCLYGDAENYKVPFEENGVVFIANIKTGQKTGFFFDQRDNRKIVWERASHARILNLFGYTGGFAIGALVNGASFALNVDSSADANQTAHDIAVLNEVSQKFEHVTEHVDVFLERSAAEKFDIVVCDPPAFAKKRSDSANAVKGYIKLNAAAIRLTRAGGEYFTFSCSQHVDIDEFRYSVARGAAISGRRVKILKELGSGIDHPVLPGHEEGGYLKGFWCIVE